MVSPSPSSSSPTVEQRLERLEGEVRLWRRAGATAVLVALCLVLMGPFLPELVVVESSQVVEGGGTCHGVFRVGATTARLSLRDGAGPGQGTGQRRAELFYSSEHGGNVSLRDASDVARATLRLPQGGGPRLTLRDAEGKSRFHAGVSGNSGRPAVYLNGSGEGALVEMATDGDTGGHLLFYDGSQNPRLKIGVNSIGLPEIALYDSRLRTRLQMGMHLQTGDAWLALFDSEGRVTHRLPDLDETPLPALADQRPNIPSPLLNVDRLPAVEGADEDEDGVESLQPPQEDPRSENRIRDIRRHRLPMPRAPR